MKLPVIPLDKRSHFLGGYALGLTFGLVLPVLGLGVAMAAGFGKEEWDRRHPKIHTADRYDALATILGGICGSTVAMLALGLTHA
jgi:hypothetical protein